MAQKSGKEQIIEIYRNSRMKLVPAKRGMGAPGLIFIFREHFEDEIHWCIDRFLRKGDKCFDIGANVGVWSLLMAEKCGDNGKVYAFEPLTRTFKNLRENIELSAKSNVTLFQTALGVEKGIVEIFSPDDPGRSSLARENVNDSVENVAINKLDDLWKEVGRPRISFVKMDVEGSEPLVLRGGQEFFRECRPVTACEINPAKLAPLGNKPSDILDYFGKLDYVTFQFDAGLNKLVKTENGGADNLVFVPNEIPL